TALTLFGNLREPIQKLRIDLTLMSAMRAKDFRVRPILLTGQPGVGKTHFALKLAEILNVPMRKWSAGSAQASFQLTGSDSAWH
ncbi:AAA family ATPase, partial [Klebsiella pneumoniae]